MSQPSLKEAETPGQQGSLKGPAFDEGEGGESWGDLSCSRCCRRDAGEVFLEVKGQMWVPLRRWCLQWPPRDEERLQVGTGQGGEHLDWKLTSKVGNGGAPATAGAGEAAGRASEAFSPRCLQIQLHVGLFLSAHWSFHSKPM